MQSLFPYHIFISHAWKYGAEYDNLERMLDAAPYFIYRNYSAPEHKPLHNLDATDVKTKHEIEEAINRKISGCSCVLVISGMYYNHRKWMQYEIDVARRMNKPIIAIRPRGAQVMPREILAVATEVVGWYTNSIVDAIRRNAK